MLTLYIPDSDPQDLTLANEIRREAALLMYKCNNWSIVRAARYALCHPRARIYWCVAIGKGSQVSRFAQAIIAINDASRVSDFAQFAGIGFAEGG